MFWADPLVCEMIFCVASGKVSDATRAAIAGAGGVDMGCPGDSDARAGYGCALDVPGCAASLEAGRRVAKLKGVTGVSELEVLSGPSVAGPGS